MDRVVEARFRQEGGGWKVELVEPAQGSQPERPLVPGVAWGVPDDPDELFLSLVPRDRCRALHGDRVRLRVRPERLDPRPGPMPAVNCWPAMYDPVGLHVYLKGWTLAEVCAPEADEPWPFDGSVTVLDDAALAEGLRAEGLASVFDGSRTQAVARQGTALVVAGRVPGAEVLTVQKNALRAKCPLVVWTDTLPAQPGNGLLELVPTGDRADEPTARYLARLITQLRMGRCPEEAVASSASDQPHGDLRARWLRGTFRPWRAPPRGDEDESLRYWRNELDRSVQFAVLTQIANGLVTAAPPRRVHVVVVCGAKNAGVDLFRRRPIPLQDRLRDRTNDVTWEPAWGDRPEETRDKLIRWLGEEDELDAFLLRLVELARTGTLLVRCIHPTADPGHPVESLRTYIARLKELAAMLGPHPVRVLVVCCMVTDDPASYKALEGYGDATCWVTALRPLDPFLTDEELWEYFQPTGLASTQAELTALSKDERGSRLAYETLIAKLAKQFPEKLSTR